MHIWRKLQEGIELHKQKDVCSAPDQTKDLFSPLLSSQDKL